MWYNLSEWHNHVRVIFHYKINIKLATMQFCIVSLQCFLCSVSSWSLTLSGKFCQGLPLWSNGKESTCQCRRQRRHVETWAQPLGKENPLEEEMAIPQDSCLENPTDRGGWWATVHRVAKSWT